jgi:N-formylmaleamate deformylase
MSVIIKKVTLLLLITLLTAFQVKLYAGSVYSFGVRIIGKGRPMIMIPGYNGSPDTYNEVVAHYKDRYKCYVITLAGFAGQPPSGVKDHLLLKQRDDIIEFIINEHLRKPVLVGFSFGCTLALWVACTRPELIGPFIALDGTPFDAAVDTHGRIDKDSLIRADSIKYTTLLSKTPAYWKRRDSMSHTPSFEKLGFIEVQKLVTDTNRIAQTLVWDKASDRRSSVLMNLEEDTLDMRNDVAKITSPILMLGSWKGWDVIKSKADAEKQYGEQYAKAKKLTIVFSENGKHFLMWEDFDWMIAQMDKFLRRE